MKDKLGLTTAAAIAIAVLLAAPAHATDWLQFGYDTAHSGYNRAENGYSTATGNKLAYPAVLLTHQADSAPVFLEGVATATGTKDLLFINALDGTLTAFDADSKMARWSGPSNPRRRRAPTAPLRKVE